MMAAEVADFSKVDHYSRYNRDCLNRRDGPLEIAWTEGRISL